MIESKFNQRNFAKYYFDCSDSLLKSDFDLLSYQTELLSDDYYNSKGALQWNFYLYFITSSKDLLPSKKFQIESDKAFTRKLIASEEELIELIEVQSKLNASPKTSHETALLPIWKSKLSTAGLSGIYLSNEYPKINDVFLNFKEKHSIVEPTESNRIVAPYETLPQPINKLALQDYRAFRSRKEFIFKKVNLIRGINGSGKTSLLEAIELCICGQTIENPRKKEPGTLEIAYANGATDQYNPGDTKKFQARDRAWYGVNTLKGNTLSQGFHIYNFFDSDEAFRFTRESNDGEKIKQTFSRIVLGEETNLVFDRIERFQDKLKAELKQLDKEFLEKSTDMNDLQLKLKAFDSSTSIVSILGEIISSLNEINWTGTDLLLSEGSNRDLFQTEASKLFRFIDLLNDPQLIDASNFAAIFDEHKKLDDLCNDSKALDDPKFFAQIQEASKLRSKFQSQQELLEKAEKYFLEEDIQLLHGIKGQINQISLDIAACSRIVDNCEEVSNIEKDSLRSLLVSYDDMLQKSVRKIAKITKEIEPLQANVGELNNLKTELVRIGKNYVQLSKDNHYCPLCNNFFSTGNILDVINNVQSRIADADKLITLSQTLSNEKASNSKLNETIAIFNEIAEDITNTKGLLGIVSDDLTIEEIEENLKKHLKDLQERSAKLSLINSRFSQLGITESELALLNSQFKEARVKLEIGVDLSDVFLREKERIAKLCKEHFEEETRLRTKRKEIEEEIISRLSSYFKDLNITPTSHREYLERARSRVAKLNQIISLKSEISEIIKFDDKAGLSHLKEKVNNIDLLLKRYIETESQNRVRKDYVSKIQTIATLLDTLEKERNRFSNAEKVLSDIILNNNKENYLKDFFNDNKQVVLDIFKALHAPNEFDDINFESTDSIKLKVKNTHETRDLSEISTGQKSAIILSLFLSLNNNLKDAPPLMIFDDPIAYVDDINTLSFLDFLRDRVISTGIQIFFATANSRLANLFQQKFEFLEEDLQIFRMDKELESVQ
jgi:DNA repair exonuclease SbcCD ATPase subunit